METAEHTHRFAFEHGFYPSQPKTGPGIVKGTARAGKNMWKRGRSWKSDRGHSTAGNSGGAQPLQLVGNQHGGMTGGGTVTDHATTKWWIGAGNAVVNGVTIGAGSSLLQLLVAGLPVGAGLAKPNAPTVAEAATASGKFQGATSLSVCVVPFRETTGAIGNRSNPSAVIVVKNKKVLLTFPTPVAGQTHWLVFASIPRFGSVGPWYRVTSVAPVPVATTSIEFDYFSGELDALAPTTNDVPPAGTHCAALGAVMCVIGSYGGYGISPSKVNQPEAYDVTQTSFLASREAVTAVTARGTDGGIFVATRNSISLIILSGSELTPVLPRGVFENVGVAHGNAMCWVYDVLYLFSSTNAACRTHGSREPDESFAMPMEQFFIENGYTGENTIVVHDQKNGAVLFCSGNQAVPYMLKTGDWSLPITLPGTVTAGVTLNGQAHLAVGSQLYTLNSAAATPSGGWAIESPYESVDDMHMTAHEFRAAADSAMVMDLLKDESSASLGGKFPLNFVPPRGNPKVQKLNRKYRSVAFKASGTAGNQEFFNATLVSKVEPMAA